MLNKLLFYDNKKKALIDVFLAVIINAVLFIVVLNAHNCIYGVSDDVAMKNIAAGGISSVPNGHVVYMKYPFGLLLSGLYTISPNLPWYSIVMYALMYASLTLILFRALNLCKNYKMLIVNSICYAFITAILYRYLVYPQFTTVALMLSCACLFFFFTQGKEFKRSDGIIIGILSAFAFCVRYEVFLMAGAFIALFYVVKLIKNKKKFVKQAIIYGAIFACVMGSMYAIDKVAYSDEDYKNYMEFDVARSNVYDFSQIPPYDTNTEFYNSINVSKPTFLCINTYTLEVGEDINVENLSAIRAKYLETQQASFGRQVLLIQKALYSMFYVSKHVILALIISLIFLLFAIFTDKRKLLVLLGCLVIAGGLTLGIILSQRVLERITICIIALFLVAMCGVIARHENYVFKNMHKKVAIVLTSICFAGSGILFAGMLKVNESYLHSDKLYLEDRVQVGETIRNYVKQHPDNFYFADTNALANITNKVKMGDNNEFLNMAYTGGWLSRSPMLKEGIEKHNMNSNAALSLATYKNAYYIANAENAQAMYEYILQYYPDKKIREVDSFLLYDNQKNTIFNSKVYSFN